MADNKIKEAALIRYRLIDPHGVTVETDVCSMQEAGIRAARFIIAQASEGYAGSIDFTGSGLKRKPRR